MIARISRLVAAGVVAVSLETGAVHAGVEPLKRSLENATQGPLDVVLSPIVAGLTTYRNLSQEDVGVVQGIGLGTMTYVGLTIVDVNASFFRMLSGLLELPLAAGLAAASPFTDWQPPVLFDVEKPSALVDHPTRAFHVKFGVFHVGEKE